MKEGWEYKTLGEVVSFSRGLTYKKSDEVDYSTKVVLRSTNINVDNNSLNIDELKYLNENIEVEEEKLIKKGAILICMSNGSKKHLGKVALIEHDYKYAFGGFMGLLTPVIKINSKYLYYTLTTPKYKEYIKSLSEGANINNLKIKDIQKYTIPIIPIDEQRRIVSYLDSSFKLIDEIKNKALKSLTEAKALFQSALTEAMESKEGWEYKTLGEVVSFSRGLTYKKSDEVDYSTKVVLRSTNINVDNNSLNIDELKYLNENIEFEEEKLIKKGSILICMSNGSKKHLGKVALIEHDYKYAFGGFMGLLTPVIKINSKYLYYTLTTPKYKEYIKSLSEGANINNLKIKDIQKYIIPIFPLNEQNQIVSRLDKLSSKVRAIEEKYQKMVEECDALKQAMLRDVFE